MNQDKLKELESNILYEDNHVLVVDKKCGILSQSDITGDIDILSLYKEYLKFKYNKSGNVYLGLVQRLDKNVSGLLILSKSTKAHTRLNEVRPIKSYLAIVEGIFIKKEDTINIKLTKDESKRIAYIDNINGKDAITKYKVLKKLNNMTLLEISIENGRFHQIRSTMSYLNHPIVNDKKYGSTILLNNNYNLLLDCFKVSFVHPTTKELITLERIPKRDLYNNFYK